MSAGTYQPFITVAQISYTLDQAAAATGLGTTTIKQAIATGDLVVHYGGERASKPILRAVDLDAWIASLPTTKGGR